MRSGAPNGHIALWDFANMPDATIAKQTIAKMTGIDYTKTSVAFHNYSSTQAVIASVKASYPVFATEVYGGTSQQNPGGEVGALDDLEAQHTSWIDLDGLLNFTHMTNTIIPQMAAHGYTWQIDP